MGISTETADRGAALTPRQREVLRLQAYGMSYEEISNHLGLSVWTVKNHHKQAVRSLQLSLTVYPSERVRTTLACYILGLLDGGVPPMEIVQRLKSAKDKHPAIASGGEDVIADEDDDSGESKGERRNGVAAD
jgi:DNA-binding CsgD family transcriptional regulator